MLLAVTRTSSTISGLVYTAEYAPLELLYLPSLVTRPSRVVFTWLIGVPPKVCTGALNAFSVVTTPGVVATRSSTLRLDNGRSVATLLRRRVSPDAGGSAIRLAHGKSTFIL